VQAIFDPVLKVSPDDLRELVEAVPSVANQGLIEQENIGRKVAQDIAALVNSTFV